MATIAQSMEFYIKKNCAAAHYHYRFLKTVFTEQSQTVREPMHEWLVAGLAYTKG